MDAGLSVIGGAIKDSAESIVHQSSGFSGKVQDADNAIACIGSAPSDGDTSSTEVLGGAHLDTSKSVNDGFDSHHCPAKACYAGALISSRDGPRTKNVACGS